MAFLFNQPIAHRFGVSLQEFLSSGEWSAFDVAAAWVRRSGTRHLLPCLQRFLRAGGATRFVIGVDIENTSREGLQDLLSLTASGLSEVFIYHNEADVTFHPKLYLFTSERRARLIVGSNNLTEAGLFTNSEAGLQVDGTPTDELVRDARTALASWRDPADGLAKVLSDDLLNDLVTEGYVLPETALRERRRRSKATARDGQTGGTRRRLFGRKIYRAPPVPGGGAASQPRSGVMIGRVLLIRVRRASETERRTQVQFPKRLVQTNYFSGIRGIQSAYDNRTHELHEARARGIVNTIKVEVPEIDSFADPVMRLERFPSGIVYQAFDANSALGRPVMDALERGRTQNPPTTFLTLPSNPSRSTWWRFI